MAMVGIPLGTQQDDGGAPAQFRNFVCCSHEGRRGRHRGPGGLIVRGAQRRIARPAAEMVAKPSVSQPRGGCLLVELGPAELGCMPRVRLGSHVDDGANAVSL